MLIYTYYQGFRSPTSIVRDTSYGAASPAAPNPDVQYRQLISRAVTQRLHSPSLDSDQPDDKGYSDAWETNERRKARDKAKTQVLLLGRSWDEFVRDVQRAEREVHVLTPTRYEGLPKSAFTERNAKAVGENERRSFVMSTGEREEWRITQQEHIMLLKSLAQARGGDCG
ncbi:hypothetical protein FB567DRAFT_474864 [Paraphoma chrysanthemicola]|uniref:Uncharacterized protein n=1 Tax=Paraphoma chrysanthemicola TaxID=798071 RepID=A0A8K0R1R9_9PLEO|nr:hypothetical protein FB567DRAFT_474864 [Paraphoma chrysanthemicola]